MLAPHSHALPLLLFPLPHLQNFFARIWILNDDLITTNKIIETGERDPRALNRIRYRICRLAKDIIQLEEILGYMLEALEVIEIPPEPPEQAGRSLYERLEISGMRNQLLRRAVDLKKNIAGTIRFLDVLREMSSVVSESKMFLLNESVDLNTKRMCLLQVRRIQIFSALLFQTFFLNPPAPPTPPLPPPLSLSLRTQTSARRAPS